MLSTLILTAVLAAAPAPALPAPTPTAAEAPDLAMEALMAAENRTLNIDPDSLDGLVLTGEDAFNAEACYEGQTKFVRASTCCQGMYRYDLIQCLNGRWVSNGDYLCFCECGDSSCQQVVY